MQATRSVKASEVKRGWYLLDAKDQVLGRFSTKIARLLLGKDKTIWVPYLDVGDYVVVINAAKVKVTGKKEAEKRYWRYSGFPGGLRSESLGKLRVRRPTEIIRRSVEGMLPGGKLGRGMIKKLYVYPGEEGAMVEKAKQSVAGSQ